MKAAVTHLRATFGKLAKGSKHDLPVLSTPCKCHMVCALGWQKEPCKFYFEMLRNYLRLRFNAARRATIEKELAKTSLSVFDPTLPPSEAAVVFQLI